MRVVKNSGIYILVAMTQAAGSFFLIPIYTAYLNPVDFGIISIMTAANQFGTILIGLSLNGAITRFYYHYKNDSKRVRVFWGTAFLISVFSSLAFLVINLLFYRWTLGLLARGIPFLPFGLICLTTACINPIYVLCRASFQARQQGYRFGLINLLYFVITIGLTLMLVVVLRLGALGYLLAILVANIFFALYAFSVFLPEIDFRFDRSAAWELLRYTLPLIPHDIASALEVLVERVVINSVLGLFAVGIYNVGSQFGGILILISAAINQAFTPWFYEKFNSSEGRSSVRFFALGLVFFYGTVAVFISCFAKETLRLMANNPAFVDGWIVVPLVATAALLLSLYYVECNILFQSATRMIPFITVSSLIFGILSNFYLTPRFGLIGAGVAGVIARATLLFGVMISVRWKGFHTVLQAKHFQIALVAIFCSLVSSAGPLQRGYLAKICLLLGYFGVIYLIAHNELRKLTVLICLKFSKASS